MLMDERVERETISPARGEIPHIDIRVTSSLHLTPQKQCIFRWFHFTGIHLLHCYVLDLSREKWNDCKLLAVIEQLTRGSRSKTLTLWNGTGTTQVSRVVYEYRCKLNVILKSHFN